MLSIFEAIETNDVSILKEVIDHGANVNKRDKKGNHPLILAIARKKKEIVKYLLTLKDIDINAISLIYDTALMTACRYNLIDIVESLLNFENIDINYVNNDRNNALII